MVIGDGHPLAPDPPTFLAAAGLTKRFGGTVALNDVDLEIRPGEVHALVGENGSGKSTMLRLLAGVLRPDGGEVRVDGRAVEFHRPRDADRAGVALVTQEGSLMPDLTVAENIFVGRLPRRRGAVSWSAVRARAHELLHHLDLGINPAATVRSLPLDQRRLVEIARALSSDPRVLLLDEPTSVFDRQEVANLLGITRALADRGMAVVFVSHRLSELIAAGHRFTVLRDGVRVGSRTRDEVDEDWLVRTMVGREVARISATTRPANPAPALEVSGLRDSMRRVRDVSLVVGRGEIVGLAGLVGAGRSELLETIVGIRPRAAGVVKVEGKLVRKGVRSAIDSGLILVAEDRSRQAVLPTLSVRDNATLTLPLARHRFFRRRQREDEAVDPLLETLDVRYASRDQPFAALSGGNQQKVLLARALLVSPRVVMLDEPTSGIDIGAKHRIYQQIIELASEGLGVLVASSELPELLAVCHRIAVVREGEIVGELDQRQMTEEGIVALATGAGSLAA